MAEANGEAYPDPDCGKVREKHDCGCVCCHGPELRKLRRRWTAWKREARKARETLAAFKALSDG